MTSRTVATSSVSASGCLFGAIGCIGGSPFRNGRAPGVMARGFALDEDDGDPAGRLSITDTPGETLSGT